MRRVRCFSGHRLHVLRHLVHRFCHTGVHYIQLQAVKDPIHLGGVIGQDCDLDMVGIGFVPHGDKQQAVHLRFMGELPHPLFLHREELQRLAFPQQADQTGFAVGLFLVLEYRGYKLGKGDRRRSRKTQGNFGALQRVANDLIRRFCSVVHLASPL